jgi:hypothetical protein
MTSLTFPQAVRDFLDLDVDSTSKYTDQTIGSNIRQASWMLERATNRIFGDQTATKKFTTNDAAYMTIPGLRTATSVTWAGSLLTADESYWLIPDNQQTGVYTGIALRGFRTRLDGPGYLHYSDWFDTNKDDPKYSGRFASLPNDLVIEGDWGYLEADIPEPVRGNAKVLAAFLTKYPDAVLASSIQTAGGGSIDYSGWPITVQEFIASWRIEQGAAGT